METTETNIIKFKSIPGYEGLYSVTSDGRIYRHPRIGTKPGFLKLRTNTTYMRVPLWKDGNITFHHVHRLVALAFIPNPLNKPQVNHMNHKKHDNCLENLEWVTNNENWLHARDHGSYRGNMLSDNEQAELFRLYCTGKFTWQQLAKKFAISLSSVGRYIVRQKNIKLAA